MRWSASKRCGCRGGDGKPLGGKCPRLRRSGGAWSASHGTWHGESELPPGPGGARARLRAGGFATQKDLDTWFAEATALLAIPEAGPEGHAARMEILALISGSRRSKAALPAYADIRRRHAEGASFTPGSTGDYLLSWLESRRQAGDLTETTLLSYKKAVHNRFLPAFGHVPLDKLRSSHVLAMLAAIDEESQRIAEAKASPDPAVRRSVAGRRPTGPATKRRILAVLRSALAEAMEPPNRLITSNPAAIRAARARKKDRVRPKLWTAEREAAWREGWERRCAALPKAGAMERFQAWRSTPARPSPVMIWTPAHIGRFLDATEDDRLYALWCLMAHCGLRRSEACGLEWAESDLDQGWVYLSAPIVQVGWQPVVSGGKTDLSSRVPVRVDQEVTVPALRRWRAQQAQERLAWGQAWTDTGLVFTREDGTACHPAYVSARFERLAFHCGLPPVRLHDLRHCAATLALAAGKDIAVVSKMLRHSSIRVTSDVYADVLPELAAEVASAVVSIVPRQAGKDAAAHTAPTRGAGKRERPRGA